MSDDIIKFPGRWTPARKQYSPGAVRLSEVRQRTSWGSGTRR